MILWKVRVVFILLKGQVRGFTLMVSINLSSGVCINLHKLGF